MAEKILVVDDDPDTLKYLSIFLQKQGFEALGALDGMTALRLAHEARPDLIILDVMMPGMDGIEVARTLRRHPDTALIPILMFTARTQTADKVAGYEAGVDIYLTKPSHPVELTANVKNLLSQRKSRQEKLVKRGYLVGVLAAKGGLGVSTLALNLAIASVNRGAINGRKKVLAAEMRPGQGTWREELGIASSFGLENLLRMGLDEITPELVEKQLFYPSFNVGLLLASSEAHNEICTDSAGQFELVLQCLGQIGDLVVVDIGANFHPAYETFMQHCDEILVVTEPQPLSVRRTRSLLADLRAHDFGSARPLTLVSVNRARVDMTLPVTKIEEILSQSVNLGFPPVPELAYLSADRHSPIYFVQPQGVLSQQFDALAETVSRHIRK